MPTARETRSAFSQTRLAVIVLWLLTVVVQGSSFAQGNSADEYAIRAAMVLNLAKFIEWPPTRFDSNRPEFIVCILGSDPIGFTLESTLQNKSVGGRPVVFRRLATGDVALACHVLYIGLAERKSVLRLLPELAKSSVLTVSELQNADNHSQIIGLPIQDDHVHIDIDLGAAQRSGLTISSKLLHLATVTR